MNLTTSQAERITGQHLFRWALPYLLQRSGKGWLLLGRDYKPLGYTADERVDYDDWGHHRFGLRCHPSKMTGVWLPQHQAGHEDKCWWFYYDATASRVDYFERLGRFYTYVKNLPPERRRY